MVHEEARAGRGQARRLNSPYGQAALARSMPRSQAAGLQRRQGTNTQGEGEHNEGRGEKEAQPWHLYAILSHLANLIDGFRAFTERGRPAESFLGREHSTV